MNPMTAAALTLIIIMMTLIVSGLTLAWRDRREDRAQARRDAAAIAVAAARRGWKVHS